MCRSFSPQKMHHCLGDTSDSLLGDTSDSLEAAPKAAFASKCVCLTAWCPSTEFYQMATVAVLRTRRSLAESSEIWWRSSCGPSRQRGDDNSRETNHQFEMRGGRRTGIWLQTKTTMAGPNAEILKSKVSSFSAFGSFRDSFEVPMWSMESSLKKKSTLQKSLPLAYWIWISRSKNKWATVHSATVLLDRLNLEPGNLGSSNKSWILHHTSNVNLRKDRKWVNRHASPAIYVMSSPHHHFPSCAVPQLCDLGLSIHHFSWVVT